MRCYHGPENGPEHGEVTGQFIYLAPDGTRHPRCEACHLSALAVAREREELRRAHDRMWPQTAPETR